MTTCNIFKPTDYYGIDYNSMDRRRSWVVNVTLFHKYCFPNYTESVAMLLEVIRRRLWVGLCLPPSKTGLLRKRNLIPGIDRN